MWRATDPAERTRLMVETFTEDGRHVDQHADANGQCRVAGFWGDLPALPSSISPVTMIVSGMAAS